MTKQDEELLWEVCRKFMITDTADVKDIASAFSHVIDDDENIIGKMALMHVCTKYEKDVAVTVTLMDDGTITIGRTIGKTLAIWSIGPNNGWIGTQEVKVDGSDELLIFRSDIIRCVIPKIRALFEDVEITGVKHAGRPGNQNRVFTTYSEPVKMRKAQDKLRKYRYWIGPMNKNGISAVMAYSKKDITEIIDILKSIDCPIYARVQHGLNEFNYIKVD